MYGNIYEYIASNIEDFHGDFRVVVTDVSEREPDTLLIAIEPENGGETAEFYLHADGTEEYVE